MPLRQLQPRPIHLRAIDIDANVLPSLSAVERCEQFIVCRQRRTQSALDALTGLASEPIVLLISSVLTQAFDGQPDSWRLRDVIRGDRYGMVCVNFGGDGHCTRLESQGLQVSRRSDPPEPLCVDLRLDDMDDLTLSDFDTHCAALCRVSAVTADNESPTLRQIDPCLIAERL